MSIVKTTGTIVEVIDLTKTAKEVAIETAVHMDFIPGSFVNIFMEVGGEKIRRAYSIATSQSDSNKISIAIRLSPGGKMSPLFWEKNMLGPIQKAIMNANLAQKDTFKTISIVWTSIIQMFMFADKRRLANN